MEIKEELPKLYDLQQLDRALAVLQKNFAALDKGQEEQTAFETARDAHSETEADLAAAQVTLRDTELEQKSVETRRKEYEEKLNKGGGNWKELQAMQEEVEMLGRQRVKLDEKILSLMDRLEASRQRASAAKKAHETAASALKSRKETYKREAEAIIAEAKAEMAKRNAAAKQIAPELLKQYENLRASKGGLAIVALEDGNACGGCKMALPSTLVTRIREATSLQYCQNCARIVYSIPKPPADPLPAPTRSRKTPVAAANKAEA